MIGGDEGGGRALPAAERARSGTAALDNPVWHALHGRLARFAAPAERAGLALRFRPDVAFFCAVDEIDDTAWAALGRLVGPGGSAVLFRNAVPTAPEGWTEVFRGPTWQLVAGDLATVPPLPEHPALRVEALGPADAEEMLALVELTEPGPFMPRTVELGGYIGVRREGRLIAMAGTRFRVPGWTEISAVCTHPDARRQGLGAWLTLTVAQAIRAQGDEAFLHVLAVNESALALYRSLGFEVRSKMVVVAALLGDPEEYGGDEA